MASKNGALKSTPVTPTRALLNPILGAAFAAYRRFSAEELVDHHCLERSFRRYPGNGLLQAPPAFSSSVAKQLSGCRVQPCDLHDCARETAYHTDRHKGAHTHKTRIDPSLDQLGTESHACKTKQDQEQKESSTKYSSEIQWRKMGKVEK